MILGGMARINKLIVPFTFVLVYYVICIPLILFVDVFKTGQNYQSPCNWNLLIWKKLTSIQEFAKMYELLTWVLFIMKHIQNAVHGP